MQLPFLEHLTQSARPLAQQCPVLFPKGFSVLSFRSSHRSHSRNYAPKVATLHFPPLPSTSTPHTQTNNLEFIMEFIGNLMGHVRNSTQAYACALSARPEAYFLPRTFHSQLTATSLSENHGSGRRHGRCNVHTRN